MENAPDDEGYCGDGIVQISSGEECDDRNRVVTDSCVSKSCVYVRSSLIAPWLCVAVDIHCDPSNPAVSPYHRV